jgi:peptide/nickel transport system substrate-binding protein
MDRDHDRQFGGPSGALSRRQFLRHVGGLAGVSAAVSLLGACAPSAPAAKPTTAPSGEAKAASQPTAGPQQAAPAATKESRLVIGYGSPAETMHPHRHYNTVTNSILQSNLYDTLTQFSQDLKTLEPALATEWRTLNDTTWQFKLRQGVRFHNGEEFDADVVKFNVESVLNPPQSAQASSITLKQTYNTIDRVEVVDKHTVNIVTSKPDPYLDRKFSSFGGTIVPPKWYQEVGEEKANVQANGTGAYKFVEWIRDQRLVLEANESYWRGAPAIKQVVIRPIPETATRVAALKAGEVDIVVNVPPEEIDPINRGGRASVKTVPSLRVLFVQLQTRTEPTMKKEVRQALNYAVDIDAIVNNVILGNGVRVATVLTDAFFGFSPEITPYKQDVNKAKELLAKAGHPNGLEVTFDINQGRYPNEKIVAEALVGQLEKAGVTARLQTNEWGAYNRKSDNNELGHLSLWGWGNPFLDADNTFNPRLRTAPKLTGLTNYSNPEFDRLIDEARATIDRDKRLAMYKQAQEILLDDPPYIFLYGLRDVYGVSSRVDWSPRSDEVIWAYYAKPAG